MRADALCAVYMLANRKHGTIYTGVSIDLMRRAWEHREGEGSVFTRKYKVTRLVWYERFDFLDAARTREKQIKKWRRDWKTNLIERMNPDWDDLYPILAGGRGVQAEFWKPPAA
jgi:putative endonuclease